MPWGDGTGPNGLGPMTGRGAGFCAGYRVPRYMNRAAGPGGWARDPYPGFGYPAFGAPPTAYPGYPGAYGFAPGRPLGGWFGYGRGRGYGRGFGRGRWR